MQKRKIRPVNKSVHLTDQYAKEKRVKLGLLNDTHLMFQKDTFTVLHMATD
jgi:hypothetical protein